MLQICLPIPIQKTRFEIRHDQQTWEVDVFEGDNAGLIVAELELQDESEQYEAPPWLGEEVSHDPRYYNTCLSQHPFKDWD